MPVQRRPTAPEPQRSARDGRHAAGHYNSAPLATANSVCSVCPANTYSGTSSRLSACLAHRTQCPTGKQLKAGTGNTTHDIECEACPAGTFQASASGAACATWRTTCDKGTQLESDGSATQDHSCTHLCCRKIPTHRCNRKCMRRLSHLLPAGLCLAGRRHHADRSHLPNLSRRNLQRRPRQPLVQSLQNNLPGRQSARAQREHRKGSRLSALPEGNLSSNRKQ